MWRLATAAWLACAGCNALFGLDAPVRAMPPDAGIVIDDLVVLEDAAVGDAMPDGPTVAPTFVRRIDIEDTVVTAGPHADFPILVVANGTWLRSKTNGGDVARADGFDIYFSSDQAGTSRLAHEVELYDAATGNLTVWIKVPSLSATTAVYLHYGDVAITTSQQNVFGVWSASYEQVLHFAALGDSSGNTASISQSNVSTTGGKIGTAASFNGTTSAVDGGSAAAIDDVFVGGGSIEAWIRPSGFGENQLGRIMEKGNPTGWSFYVDNSNRPSTVTFLHGTTGTDGIWVAPNNAISLNAWHHVVAVFDRANTPVIYVDGTATAPTLFTSLSGSFESDANTVMLVGNNTDGDRAYDGVIDEVRVSSMSRSASWFATEYRNQSDPTTCYVISAPL